MWRLLIVQGESCVEYVSEDKHTLMDMMRYLSDCPTREDTSYTFDFKEE